MPADLHAVCVFAASSDKVGDNHRALARELGRAVAEAGWRLVYGGGQAGLMGEVAQSALDAGGHVTGIIPRRLNSVERAFDDVTDLVLVDSLAERKIEMDRRSDAFAVLPGGVGTLDEITDVLATRHLGHPGRALVMVDPDGFWQPLIVLLRHMVDSAVLQPESLEVLTVARSVDEAVEALGRR